MTNFAAYSENASWRVWRVSWSGGVLGGTPANWADWNFNDAGWDTTAVNVSSIYPSTVLPAERIAPLEATTSTTLETLIWLARSPAFTLAAIPTSATIFVGHDDGIEVFINGTSVYSNATVSTAEGQARSISTAAFRVGSNTLAVRTTNIAGSNVWATNPTAMAVRLVLCDPLMAFDVYSLGTATTPALTYLATLCDAFDKSFRVELDGTGSGKFSINRSSEDATAAILGNGDGNVRYVQCRIPTITAAAIFGFFIEEGDFRLLDADEDGGETLTFTGHGSLAYLDFAVMAAHSYLTTPFIGEDPFGGLWRLYLAGTGSKPGQILQRIVAETQEASRPQKPLPLLTDTFDYTNDSNAAAWASSTATNAFSAQIGESVLSVGGRLIGTGAITVQMSPAFVLGAYNSYGTDRSNATFAAGKVRFVAGTNIADGLSRQLRPSTVATHSIVYGESEISAIAAISGAATRVTREVFMSTTGTITAALGAIGSADLAERLLRSESLSVRIILGSDASTGLYLPWTSFWVGDTITVYTGTGEYDYNNTSFRVAAINIVEPAAAVLATDLEVTVELGSAGILEGSAPGSGLVSAGGGSSSVVPVHSHPAQVPWSYAKEHGLKGDGVTDDTAAFQAWITSVTASGTQSGWFFFEPGVYLIGGALQDTGAYNAQILLPTVTTANKQITLTFTGVARPPFEWVGPSAPGVGSGYSIIKSTLTGGTGTAACISGGNNGTGLANINNIRTVWQDLIFIGPDNPTFTMLNLGQCQGSDLYGVQIATPGGYSGSLTQPTNTNAYGVKMPAQYMANVSLTDELSIGEWYTCIRLGEMDQHRGLVLGNCIVAMEAPVVFYPTIIETVQLTGFTYGLKATGIHYVSIANYVAEHSTGAPAWRNTIYDVDDVSNQIAGDIKWHAAVTGGAIDHTFAMNGGTGLWTHELIKLAPNSGVTAATYGSATTSPVIAVDVYGRITSASNATISAVASYVVMVSGSAPPDPVLNTAGDDWVYSS